MKLFWSQDSDLTSSTLEGFAKAPQQCSQPVITFLPGVQSVLTQAEDNCGTAVKLLDWTDALPIQAFQPLLSELYSVPSRGAFCSLPKTPPDLEN